MSGRREDDMSALAWPGFVDILSAVVIMFVFFLLITATALYFHTIIFKSKVVHQSDVQIKAAIQQQEEDDLKREVRRLKLENEELKDQVDDTQTEGTSEDDNKAIKAFKGEKLEESSEQSTDLSGDNMVFTIFFGSNSITLIRETQVKLHEFLEGHKSKISSGEYIISLEVGKMDNAPTKSISREVALARMFNIRSKILGVEGLPRKSIKASIKPPVKIKNSNHWGQIIIKKKE